MFKRILFTTDFSEASHSAIGRSVQLARSCNAEVSVIHVVSDFKEVLREAFLDRGAQIKRQAELEANLDLVLPDEAYPGAIKSLVWGASIPGEIIKFATQEKFDLVVCGTHGRGLLARTLLGSVTQELVRNSPVPVLVIPQHEEMKFGSLMDRILVPIDYSMPSIDALDFALKLSQFFKSTLVLFHAIHIPVTTDTSDIYPQMVINQRATEELKNEAKTEMKQILDARNASANITTEVVYGEPAPEILRYAKESGCSFIVMGSHGRKGLERAILGSVTTSVLARTKIPVFTLPAKP